MSRVVLLHGWGYDASLWDTVRDLLPAGLAVDTIDLGYFGAARPAAAVLEPVTLAVGHSLGALWWLTQTTEAWQRLLCINGFARFTATAGYLGVAPRLLARMRQQFSRDPAAVLADFHARCGGHAPAAVPDIPSLAAGLGWLADCDGRTTAAARRRDIFALAGTHDPIVPPAMSAGAFPDQCEFIASTGHLLPLTAPAACAARIARLAK